MDTRRLDVTVLGYGTPRTLDGNQMRYVSSCMRTITELYSIPENQFGSAVHFTFVGGATNRPYRTEAESLRDEFVRQLGIQDSDLHYTLVKDTTTVRDNIRRIAGFYYHCNLLPGDTVHIFCERSRVPTVQMFVNQFWAYGRGKPVVDGIGFDGRSLTRRARLRQNYLVLPLEYLALKVGGPFEAVRSHLRERTLRKAQALARYEDQQASQEGSID